MTNPVLTQCGHRYCNDCVLNAIKAMPSNKENNYFCKCSLCDQKITKRSLIKQDHLFEIVEQTKSLIELFEKKHPGLSVADAPAVFEVSQLNNSFNSDIETPRNHIKTTPSIPNGRQLFKRPAIITLDHDHLK